MKSLKPLLTLTVAMLVAGCAAFAPDRDATSITDAEIGAYKVGIGKGCTEHRADKGGDSVKVKTYCECVMSVFSQSLTREEWQAAAYAAQKQRDHDEGRIFARHSAPLSNCKSSA